MIIQHNIPAMNSHRNLGINNAATSKNLEKLSSGYKINRAGDDAAGLAISEKMRGQIRGLAMATQNAQNGVSLIQTAEGGLNETHAILQRMRELAVQSANGTYDDEVDRANISKEVDALKSEINRIASSTHYNGINLLDGTMGGNKLKDAAEDVATLGFDVESVTFATLDASVVGETATLIIRGDGAGTASTVALQIGDKTYSSDDGKTFKDADGKEIAVLSAAITDAATVKDSIIKIEDIKTGTSFDAFNGRIGTPSGELIFQIGANGTADQRVGLHVDNMSAANLGLVKAGLTIQDISVGTRDEANNAIAVIDAATNQVSGTRADLGALQNRLEHTINNLGVTKENLQAAESSIRDVDMAKEMMEFTKNNILVQASQAMLAQANQLPQGVLQLLR